MFTDTKKVVALAALIVATGVATVEVTRGTAQAGPVAHPDYAATRIAEAFQVAATMPPVAPVSVPMAVKGDLEVPAGCRGADDEAECMDTAYEPDAIPSVVVESRAGTTTTLMRMDAMTLAGVTDAPLPRSE